MSWVIIIEQPTEMINGWVELRPQDFCLRKGSSKAYKLLERLSEPLAELQCCSLQGKNHEFRLAFWLNCFLAMLQFLVNLGIEVENSPVEDHFSRETMGFPRLC